MRNQSGLKEGEKKMNPAIVEVSGPSKGVVFPLITANPMLRPTQDATYTQLREALKILRPCVIRIHLHDIHLRRCFHGYSCSRVCRPLIEHIMWRPPHLLEKTLDATPHAVSMLDAMECIDMSVPLVSALDDWLEGLQEDMAGAYLPADHGLQEDTAGAVHGAEYVSVQIKLAMNLLGEVREHINVLRPLMDALSASARLHCFLCACGQKEGLYVAAPAKGKELLCHKLLNDIFQGDLGTYASTLAECATDSKRNGPARQND